MDKEKYIQKYLQNKKFWIDEWDITDDHNRYNSLEDYLLLATFDSRKQTIYETIFDRIKKESKGNILYHFSEHDTEYQHVLFYKVLRKDDVKYIALESSSYDTNVYYKFRDFNNVYRMLNREEYCELISKETVQYESYKYFGIGSQILDEYENIIKLNEFTRFGIASGLEKIKQCEENYLKPEELFYINDYLLFNHGKGRKELDISDVNPDTNEGSYYSFSCIVNKNDQRTSTLLDVLLS